MKRIVFPEINHPYVQEAIKLAKQKFPDFEAIGADNLEHACAAVKAGVADSMIAGIDYTSRCHPCRSRHHRRQKPAPARKTNFLR